MSTTTMKNYSLFLFYVLVSLLIGEFHPFSRYEMYNSFPPTALAFMLTTPNGNIIPLKEYFHYKTADLSHNYSALQAEGIEKNKGRQLFEQLLTYRFKALPFDTVVLQKTELQFTKEKLNVVNTPVYEYHP